MFYGEIFPNMENSIFSFILFIIKYIIIIITPSLYFMENYLTHEYHPLYRNIVDKFFHVVYGFPFMNFGCFINLNFKQ
jgi:hypothetical protein